MRKLLLKLRRRATLERDLDEEFAFHQQMSDGPFGNVTRLREDARELWTFPFVENLLRDVRYAFRALRKSPSYTCVCALTLALGISLNTAVFTVDDALTHRLLPVQDPSSLFRLVESSPHRSPEPAALSFHDVERLQETLREDAEVLAASSSQTMFSLLPDSRGNREGVKVQLVSSNFFSSLGVPCPLAPSTNVSPRRPVIASHTFWARRFSSDPALVGKNLVIGQLPVELACIAPKGFYGTDLPPRMPDLWLPLDTGSRSALQEDLARTAQSRIFHVLLRAKPSIDLDRIRWKLTRLGPLAVTPATAFQANLGGFHGTGPILAILMGVVSVILLIGCANLVNLTLSRNAARRREIATRFSLGASTSQIVRQLCTESLLLGCLGGLFGLGPSVLLCQAMQAYAAMALEQISAETFGGFQLDLSLNWRVFVYTLLLSALTGVAVGIWPALSATRSNLSVELKRDGVLGRQRQRLLTVQVAVCFTLLAMAGLLFRGTRQSKLTEPGFPTNCLLLLAPDLTITADSPEARVLALRQVLEQTRALPQVVKVTLVDRAPFLGTGANWFQNEQRQGLRCRFNLVSGEYFDTLQVPVVMGRTFSEDEAQRELAAVVVSQGAAQFFWPGRNPLGQYLSVASPSQTRLPHSVYRVIGVAKDVRSTFLSKPDDHYLYFPKTVTDRGGWIVARMQNSADRLLPLVRDTLQRANPSVGSHLTIVSLNKGPIQIQTLMTAVPGQIALALGVLAVVLASVGVYGVMMYLVAQRIREIGICRALGAQRTDVVRLVVSEGLVCVIRGMAIGVAGALVAAGLIAALVRIPDLPDLTYQAGVFDPATFLFTLGAIALAAGVACLRPLYRAMRVDPMVALRVD